MADIAFLLLVFFLVTTNISQDYGITTNISKPFQIPDSLQIHHSELLINKDGKFMVNNKTVLSENVCEQIAADFTADRNVKNVLVVKSDREVSFNDFLNGLNEGKRAFKLFYNEIAQAEYQTNYNALEDSLKIQLKLLHPVALTEDVINASEVRE